MTSSITKFNHLRIPLEEISKATNNFADENLIGRGAFGKVYKGRLWWSEQWIDICARRLDRRYGLGDVEFWAEISMLSSLNHRNLVSIIGFCDEKHVKIIINKHEAKGSLELYLIGSTFTWMQRLKICVGVAHGLRYLHNSSVIHHNINSSTILLDHKWEPKLSGFEFSLKTPSIRNDRVLLIEVGGTLGYVDPEHEKTGGVTYESDVFSFGVVLFEILCGRKAYSQDHHNKFLAPLARLRYDEKRLEEIVDPDLLKNMDTQSLHIFSEIAYACLMEERAQRPNMDEVVNKLEELLFNLQWKHENPEQTSLAVQLTSTNYWKAKHLEHLTIPLKDIMIATNDFHTEYCVERTNYFDMYEARLKHFDSHSFSAIEWNNECEVPKRTSHVLIKRFINTKLPKGREGFIRKVEMLSTCRHRNIDPLLGFCDEGTEMIIVHEYPSKGCLVNYLNVPYFTKFNGYSKKRLDSLSWGLRLKICLGIAHGLNYLHTTMEDKQTVIHGNIKSLNIVFSDYWEPKITGFRLLEIDPWEPEEDYQFVSDDKRGKIYCDPEYFERGTLTAKSDIYSFGVVLFEILCGDLVYNNRYYFKKFTSPERQNFDEGALERIVAPDVREEMDGNKDANFDSMVTFLDVAYQCLVETADKRPKIEFIIKELEKALYFLDDRKLSLNDIIISTRNFSSENMIGRGGFGNVYIGELQHANIPNTIVAKRLERGSRQGEHQYLTELQILLKYKHDNVVKLFGYCDEMDENIIVYEYMSKGSLDKHLKNTSLTLKKRIEICLDVARGLEFLHGGGVSQAVVIHRDIKSANILLNVHWQAKIADFGLSLISTINKETNFVVNYACGTPSYCDPLYITSGLLTRESDIYSLGVVLLELLSGRLAYEKHNNEYLTKLAKHHFKDGTFNEVVFDGIKEQMSSRSLTLFLRIAFDCLDDEREQRPTAGMVIRGLELALELQDDQKISFKDITAATRNFSSENRIERVGFGKVYKGELQHADVPNTILAKRLGSSHQGNRRYLTELQILVKYRHENVINHVGYCHEMHENIIVYEYMSNGSLDKHLKNTSLTWRKRLEICLDVARGLEFIHRGGASQEMVIHRDIKSANILLNVHWQAKIANFGLSLIPKINKEIDFVANYACGTPGYCDPLYVAPGLLTRESDIYSYGVVLLELLSGRLAYETHNSECLPKLAKQCFEDGTFDELVFHGIKEQMSSRSLTLFLRIAFECLDEMREQRPTAGSVITRLELALELQKNPLRLLSDRSFKIYGS